ncbi:uncharacterized protein LOC124937999 [Impatiens glandulifera]|uniref:uncharacterized protein LOC124937999 n=1 Tax=Impatiens glandulifera TaxID=253017 RepID=UPI001FB0EF31|nr:uncharacterized protein LOC124937999 [Impatiens glandulifera]
MANLVFCSSLSLSSQRFPSFRSSFQCNPPSAVCFPVRLGRRQTRGLSVVTRAAPSANTYLFAFFLPLSLLAITVLTSISIDMQLDKRFMEEMAVNEGMTEADDDNDDEEDGEIVEISPREKAVRTRNRPKKEVKN